MKRLILSALILLAAPASRGEPPPAAEETLLPYEYSAEISADHVRHRAATFIAMDARFIFELIRESARVQASPGFTEGYQATRAKGWFDGSETEYALLFAVSRLDQPYYGYGAQIYCPPNDPTYIVLMRHWSGKEIDCQTYDPMDRYGQD